MGANARYINKMWRVVDGQTNRPIQKPDHTDLDDGGFDGNPEGEKKAKAICLEMNRKSGYIK